MKKTILGQGISFALVFALSLNSLTFASPSSVSTIIGEKVYDVSEDTVIDFNGQNGSSFTQIKELETTEHVEETPAGEPILEEKTIETDSNNTVDNEDIQLPVNIPEGTGTEINPVQIASGQDLLWFCENVWRGKEISAGVQATSAHVVLTQDINIRGLSFYIQGIDNFENSWIPIGSAEHPFSGVFDGCGYTVSGYSMTRNYVGEQGLFGVIEGGTIINVKMDNIKIEEVGGSGNTGIQSNLAGIVGYIKNGTIRNCHVSGSVQGQAELGGIVGSAEGTRIENCSAEMVFTPIIPINPNNYPSTSYYGGIAGKMVDCTVKDCWANIDARRLYMYGGGIAGHITTSSIENCYSNVYIEGRGFMVGGLVGAATDSSVSHCFTLGHVGGNYNVASICGNSTNTDIINCANMLSYLGGLTMGVFYYTETPKNYQGTISGNKSYSLTQYYPPSPSGCGTLINPYILATSDDFFYNIFTHDSTAWESTQGNLPLLHCLGESQDSSLPDYLQDAIDSTVVSVPRTAPVSVPYDIDAETLERIFLPNTVTIVLGNKSEIDVPVKWNTALYNGTLNGTIQELSGILTLPEEIKNYAGLRPLISVEVLPLKTVIAITPQTIETWQNLLLDPTDKVHSLGGSPTVEKLPKTAWAKLSTGEFEEFPVIWNVAQYDSTLVGTQSFLGEIVVDPMLSIGNPNGLSAVLNITVIPKEYLVVEAEEVSISALLGTGIDGLNDILTQEGKNELDVWALDEDWVDAYTYCNIVIAEDQGLAYDMNTPGEYILTAIMPENFLNFESEVNEVQIFVTVLEASEIVQAEASMDYYQSAAREDLSNIPTQAAVTLENGYTILSDVEWDWGTFNKDYVGEQIVLGTLVNIPAAAKQPDGQEIKATMVVNVVPMQYSVTGVKDNVFTASAGLTLDEVNAILAPTVTLNITSTVNGVDFTTEYPIIVTLEMGGSGFDPEYADEYTFMGLYELPENIVWPETVANEIYLTTTPVEIIEVEELYGAAEEGQEFDELELPTQVIVTLSCIGMDGENKKAVLDVDWGTGEGYTPVPDVWNDNGTATLIVTGAIANCPQYISNGEEMLPTVEITMIPAPNLVLVSPSRIPAETALEVKVGSTLEDIYAAIDSHTVQLTLEDYQGNQYSVDMTFALRLEDNEHYDSMTQGTYTLYGYLPLGSVIKNPDALNVQVVVKTMKYSIFSVQTTPWTSTVGTAFENLGLPEKATIVRNDKKTEELNVTWNGSKYNSTKIGNQVISGTLDTPLPVHLTNPSNRQPKVLLTLVDPDTQILSLTQVTNEPGPGMLFSVRNTDEGSDSILGFTEYRFWAELQHKDGAVTTEMISIYVETADSCIEEF